ncbi:hypothetical protein PN836_010330 [Ningiella sp. W23]|uniref:hypothetical protein n=1 Tax=Ningiella sp. W23 TaxID=3023715 RepID=UPI003758014A
MTINPAAAAIRQRNTLKDESKTLVMVAWGLLLAGWVLMPFAPIAAIIIAVIASGDTDDAAARSHYSKLKSTFWFSCLWGVVCFLFVLIAMAAVSTIPLGLFLLLPMSILLGLFCTYRSIKGIIRASENKAYF